MGNVISDLAEGASKGLFSGIGDMAVKIRQSLKGVELSPDKIAEVEATLAALERDVAIAQTQVNDRDSQSQKWWQAGWRPFAGWVCGFGLALQFLVFPLVVLFGVSIPAVDFSQLINLLIGMLGLGALRTFEKTRP